MLPTNVFMSPALMQGAISDVSTIHQDRVWQQLNYFAACQ
jgi:hypothetical protein